MLEIFQIINFTSKNELLLTTSPFPPIYYFLFFLTNGKVQINKSENYQKKSIRNRIYLLGANGVLRVSIPLVKGKNHQCPIGEVKIYEESPWRYQLEKSIQSQYRSSPFYPHYIDDVREMIYFESSFLWNYNVNTLQSISKLLNINLDSEFILTELRTQKEINYFTPSTQLLEQVNRSYTHVFPMKQKDWNIPLSILDMIFCVGPETILKLIRLDHEHNSHYK